MNSVMGMSGKAPSSELVGATAGEREEQVLRQGNSGKI